MEDQDKGFLLYARPSFFEGMARIIDFGGLLNTYNTSTSPDKADGRAIASDWEAVARDLRYAARVGGRHEQKKIKKTF